MVIQTKLKLLRHDRGYRQEDVARLMGISIPAYSKMETGVTDLNYSRIVQLAVLYGLRPVQLIDPAHDPLKKDDALLLKMLQDRLAKREQQICELQSKMIALYEQLNLSFIKKTGLEAAGAKPAAVGRPVLTGLLRAALQQQQFFVKVLPVGFQVMALLPLGRVFVA